VLPTLKLAPLRRKRNKIVITNLKDGQKLLSTPELYSTVDSRRKSIADVQGFTAWRGWTDQGVWFAVGMGSEGFNKEFLIIEGFSEQGETLGSGYFPIHVVIGMRLAFLDKAVVVVVGDNSYLYVPGVPVEELVE